MAKHPDEVNLQKLQDELKLINIMALYDFMCPIDYRTVKYQDMKDREEKAIERCREDPLFHARVNQIAMHSMKAVCSEFGV